MKPIWTATWNERVLNEYYPQIRKHKVDVYMCIDDMPCAICGANGKIKNIPKRELKDFRLIEYEGKDENSEHL